MKKILFVAALFFLASNPAHALLATDYGYVAVASHTYTAVVSTTVALDMRAIEICNDSSTGTIRCGYDVSVSTISANSKQGFPILKETCVYREIRNIPYCKSEVAGQITPVIFEVFK
jgi:hypothetical protein